MPVDPNPAISAVFLRITSLNASQKAVVANTISDINNTLKFTGTGVSGVPQTVVIDNVELWSRGSSAAVSMDLTAAIFL